jgi:hypothetical protein
VVRLRGRCTANLALALALTLAGVLGGCANVDMDPNAGWFSKPFDPLGRASGFAYYEFKDSSRGKPITAADLVDANGACAAPPGATPPPPPPAADNPGGALPAAQPEPPTLLSGGIALGMSECDVVNRAGAASVVDVGRGPGGGRSAVLTFRSGPWPGIYHFRDGRLTEIERVAAPPPETPPKKKPARPARRNDNA